MWKHYKKAPGRWLYRNDHGHALVIANDVIKDGLERDCLKQLENCTRLPGLRGLVLNPDGHVGYGAPIGSVLVSDEYLYPVAVGYDIKCSMSLLQTDIPADAITDKRIRRALIDRIMAKIPSGVGRGGVAGKVPPAVVDSAPIHGFTAIAAQKLGIPDTWIERCEDATHGRPDVLLDRLDWHRFRNQTKGLEAEQEQLGTYGAGNHFGECTIVNVESCRDPSETERAAKWGLKDGCVAMLSHCGSRGFGWTLANYHYRALKEHFKKWCIPYPGNDHNLGFIPLGTPEANAYLQDIALAGNFATVNHMVINQRLTEAFQEVIPGCKADLVYYISHNFARKEYDGKRANYVHRKGATRAFPPRHHELKSTPFHETGHPILLPGNPVAGSRVMVGCGHPNDSETFFSINHGAGRAMGRRDAKRTLTQEDVDEQMEQNDILFPGRHYPVDEAAPAYKDFEQVLASVELASLAKTVARLSPAKFVVKAED